MRGEIAPLATDLLDRIEPAGEEYVLCVLWAAGPPPAHVERARRVMATIPGPARQPYLIVGWALFAGPSEPDTPVTPLEREFAASRDPWVYGLHLFGRSFRTVFTGGDLTEAERDCATALDEFRAAGDRWGQAQALDALATFADQRGDSDRALELTDRALEVVGQIGAAEELAELRCRRADRLLSSGDVGAARADYELAETLARRAGVPATVALAQSGLGEVARLNGDLVTARRQQELALAGSTVDWSGTGARAQVLTALGRVAEAEGNAGEAGSLYRQAVDLARDNRIPATAEEAAAGLARIGPHAS